MQLVRFTKEKAIPEGSGRVKLINGVPVIVVRSQGKLHAYIAVCDHKGYVLCERSVRNNRLVCPGHGEEFNVDDGSPVRGKAKSRLPKLALEVRDGVIYIEPPGEDLVEWVRKVSEPR